MLHWSYVLGERDEKTGNKNEKQGRYKNKGDINKGNIEKEETGLNKRVQKDPVAASFLLASWGRARDIE